MKGAILLCFAAAVAACKPNVREPAPPQRQERMPAFLPASEDVPDAQRAEPSSISLNSPPSPPHQAMPAPYLPAPREVQTLSALHTMQASSAQAGPPVPPSHRNPEVMPSFIPTPEGIQALHALHTMHAPAVIPNARARLPSMPPAAAQFIATYRGASGSFAHANRFV
ncbi:WAS/WASL-interacting protein family member 3-like [Penaeus monodon]|uniref:WAS/WASL-interacting protein family member 3-like n=1 Tax=Penaeus monodon TaxID=6687 RepID=UPI0018A78A49|nr:WAS/WASL-interacting protein family member 3-like [Penaeus monodon]